MSAQTMSALTTPACEPARVLFVDDHRILLEALAVVVSPQYLSRHIDSLAHLEQAVSSFSPDVVVMDIAMPDGDGLLAAQRLLRQRPGIKLILLTMHTDRSQVRRAAEAGVHGFVSKREPAQELLLAIERTLNGERYTSPKLLESDGSRRPSLTDRQNQVLKLVARGCSAKEIATELNISVRTAEFHRGAIMQRLGLHSTALVTRYAVEHNLI